MPITTGLKAQDLNGLKAIVSAYDKVAGRYVVSLTSKPGKSMKIKPENLRAWTATTEKVADVPKSKVSATEKSGPPQAPAVENAAAATTPVRPAGTTAVTTVSHDTKKNVVVVKVKIPRLESSAHAQLQVSDTDLVADDAQQRG